MPYALCPMPYAQSYLIFLRKAIYELIFDIDKGLISCPSEYVQLHIKLV
jgi:hypothetical protein